MRDRRPSTTATPSLLGMETEEQPCKAEQKSLVPAWQAQWTNQPFICTLESQFTSTIGQICSLILKVYFGSMVTAVLIGWNPQPPSPVFGLIYEGALGQPRQTTSLCCDHEFIDPVFTITSSKLLFSMTENERFGLAFARTGSINSGTLSRSLGWQWIPYNPLL